MPLDLNTLLIFIPFMILAAASPGPDVLYIVSRSLGRNRWTGVVAAAGIATGLAVLSVSVAFGMGQVFSHVPMAYDIMKIVGAVYLLYLAYKILRSSDSPQDISEKPEAAWRDVYLQGLFTNLLNPKAIIFFMAVLPQFSDPTRGDLTPQLASIAALATVLGFLTHSAVGLLAHWVARNLSRPSPLRGLIQRYVLAGLFGYVALRLALSHKPG